MRRIIWVFLAITMFNYSTAQEATVAIPDFPTEEETGKIHYERVIQTPGKASELFAKAEDWVEEFYKNGTSAVHEKKEGEIVLKPRFRVMGSDEEGNPYPGPTIQYTASLKFKDGRFKLDITRIIKRAASYYGVERMIEDAEESGKQRDVDFLVQIDDYFLDLIDNLEEYMTTSQEEKKEAW